MTSNATLKGRLGKDDNAHRDYVNRKRVQNRISQQCRREKTYAHAKQLELLTEMIKSNSHSQPQPTADTTSQPTDSLDTQLSLVQENRELRDALLEMRKKLLSLSSAAAAAADYCLKHSALPPTGAKSRKVQKPSRRARQLDQEDNERTSDLEIGPSASSESREEWPQVAEGPLPSSALEESWLMGKADAMHPAGFISFPGSLGLQYTPQSQDECLGTSASEILQCREQSSHAWPMFPLFSPDPVFNYQLVPSFATTVTALMYSRSKRVQAVEQACIMYLARTLNIPGAGQTPCSDDEMEIYLDQMRAGIADVDDGLSVVADVARLGVEVIARNSDVGNYIFGVGGNMFLESVLQWRCSPTHRNRLAVRKPFQPTPLQYLNMKHCMALDFINWPSVRDQLIVKAPTYDIDQMLSDIVTNTVVEIPRFKVSINIQDTFVSRVLNLQPSASTHGDLGGLSNTSQDSMDLDAVSPEDKYSTASILQVLAHKFQVKEKQNDEPQGSRNTAQSFLKSRIASIWSLDQVERWRLSKEFALAHPEIDCSSGEFYPVCLDPVKMET